MQACYEMKWIDEAIEKIREKMSWSANKNQDKIPYTTDENGNYDDRSGNEGYESGADDLSWWTNGFWSGLMWLMYQDTRDEKYREFADKSERKLAETLRSYYGLHHDVGFMFVPSAVINYQLTGNLNSRRTALHAANLLAGRFNPAGNYIRAWNDWGEESKSGWAIIDCMMNLSLLYWASEESQDPRFKNIAQRHADTAAKYFVRADGSVNHIVEFNPETGEFVRSYGGQGYGEGSSWTRGQGWAIYGFMLSYLHTRKKEYLDTAKKVAKYCIENIGEDGIIPVDFRQPEEPAYEDSCGACIIACGLLELAEAVSGKEREIYEQTALKILRTIYEKRADFTHDCDAIVQNCSSAYHDTNHHITMCYADYYFVEAIQKIKKIGIRIW